MTNRAVKKNVKNEVSEFISVISSNQCARIRIDDIELIEQEGRRVHVVTPEKDYTFYESMAAIVKLLANRGFYRPMKGMIINLDHVKDISGFYVNF
ncbi:MAG: LytTR family transcriptional regulator DNA-binding domain-containing protein [Mogibacterium sp.]|nr:LytTR family transcriptional regulator DNA-binding domain-containing protein [Mogibacterium sp.]